MEVERPQQTQEQTQQQQQQAQAGMDMATLVSQAVEQAVALAMQPMQQQLQAIRGDVTVLKQVSDPCCEELPEATALTGAAAERLATSAEGEEGECSQPGGKGTTGKGYKPY